MICDKQNILLTKQDTNMLKGSAALMIMASHLSYILIVNTNAPLILKFIQKTGGGYGVLIFFFVSGYGLTKSGCSKQRFWRTRLKKIIIPSLCLLLFFSIIIQTVNDNKDITFILSNMLTSAWFIDVIFMEYLFYYVAHKASSECLQLIVTILMNIVLAIAFNIIGLDERWYNAMLLFPFGMFMAHNEQTIIPIIANKITGIVSAVMFIILGVAASVLKGMMVAVFLKTFAGIGLAVAVCSLLHNVCISFNTFKYIGKRSLYYYIIHVELIILLSDLAEDFPVLTVGAILIITVILSELCHKIFQIKKI